MVSALAQMQGHVSDRTSNLKTCTEVDMQINSLWRLLKVAANSNSLSSYQECRRCHKQPTSSSHQPDRSPSQIQIECSIRDTVMFFLILRVPSLNLQAHRRSVSVICCCCCGLFVFPIGVFNLPLKNDDRATRPFLTIGRPSFIVGA